MADNTKTDDGLAIELEEAKAILKVAYLLTAIDGTICEREQAQFRAIMKRLLGEHYTTPEGMAYLEDVAEEARKLLALRAFYTEAAEDKAFLTEDNAFLKVFAAKATPSLATIMQSKLAIRSAFAVWIGICCTDRAYTPIERLAVKMLQKGVNACFPCISIIADGPLFNPCYLTLPDWLKMLIRSQISDGPIAGRASKPTATTDRIIKICVTLRPRASGPSWKVTNQKGERQCLCPCLSPSLSSLARYSMVERRPLTLGTPLPRPIHTTKKQKT